MATSIKPCINASVYRCVKLLALPLAAFLVVQSPAFAEELSAPAAATAAASTTQQNLDQILAPIALYPDALIAQILMASTYPLEVVEAARWVKANPKLHDKALEEAMLQQSWDPSVKALTSVPQVLQQMNDNLAWTQKLGDAFLADQKAVLATVQSLRAKAVAAGNLKSTPEQSVNTETQNGETIYIIESAQPEVIYVPTYNPYTIYGTWWYPYPPYYMYPPSYVYPPHVAFHGAIFVGFAIWGHCNWHGGSVNVNINHYNRYNHSNISNPGWNHNVDHRKGVAYKDNSVAQQYNRGASTRDVQSREQFRGHAEQGRAEMDTMGRAEMQNRVQQAERSSMDNRAGERMGGGSASYGAGSRDYAGSTSRGSGYSGAGSTYGGGFSGAGNGASTRQASSQGGASRGSMGGGMRGGGGRGGGRR
jgi:uncharacterized membrane protein YgcG